MTMHSAEMPDRRYYLDIQQLPDKTWTAEQKPLDDTYYDRPDMQMVSRGLRSEHRTLINDMAFQRIADFAPPYKQSNALYVIQKLEGKSPLTEDETKALADAHQLFADINAQVAFGDSIKRNFDTFTFNDFVAWNAPPLSDWPKPVSPKVVTRSEKMR